MDKGEFKIQIIFEGENLTLEVYGSSTVDQLKHQIQQWNNIAPSEQILTHDGFLLQDNKTLEDQDVRRESLSKIYQTKIVTGGGAIPVAFSSLTNSLEVEFSSSAPPGRIIQKGLSLEGKCQSNECRSSLYKVIVHKGFGDFVINKEVHNAKCPLCENKTKDNFAPYFYQCKFIIEGLKVGETDEFKLEGIQNELKSSKTFKSQGLDNSDWEWLIIKVKKL